jgi:[ribosomal protein S5]-alanine N-acetyltransferase
LFFQLFDINSKKIIGWCGYHTWYIKHLRGEIGYELYDVSFKRQGYMSEALEVIIDYGFNTMHLNQIEAFVAVDNVASLKTLHKFQFVQEGHLREHYSHEDKPEDSLVFYLLKRDFVI